MISINPSVFVNVSVIIKDELSNYEQHRIFEIKLLQMKSILVSFLLLALLTKPGFSQQVVNEAIIQLKTETTLPESSNATINAPEGAFVMRIGDGEIKTKLFFKNGMTKLENDMGMATNQVIYDSKTKTTTTLFEAMGRKTGFYATDEDMQRIPAGNDSNQRRRIESFNPEVTIEYLNETKKIAGLNCYKANIRYKNRQGEEVQQPVWYSPDFILGEGFRLRELMRMASMPGLNKLKGFPMEFDLIRQNGAKIHFEVIKVDLTAKVDDKVFAIPKDYQLKSMSEMNRGGRPGEFIIRN